MHAYTQWNWGEQISFENPGDNIKLCKIRADKEYELTQLMNYKTQSWVFSKLQQYRMRRTLSHFMHKETTTHQVLVGTDFVGVLFYIVLRQVLHVV